MLWPADSLQNELRSLNRQFMAFHNDPVLRGNDCWPNRQPGRFPEEWEDARKHGAAPIAIDDASFGSAIVAGRFNWAVLLDGTLRISPSILISPDGPVRISHAILAPKGGAVLAAGEGKVDLFLSGTTGHYKNEPFVVPPVRKAFETIGIFFKR